MKSTEHFIIAVLAEAMCQHLLDDPSCSNYVCATVIIDKFGWKVVRGVDKSSQKSQTANGDRFASDVERCTTASRILPDGRLMA